MRLIGMMDSPYVRRVAVSLKLMGLPFAHEPVSVFRHYDTFAGVNPVVKAPTMVTDDGTVLMDSTLILDVVERLVPADRRLIPNDAASHVRGQRLVGLALAAAEKAVQIVYERTLRPAERQHQPWVDRVHAQLLAACRLLNDEIAPDGAWLFAERPLQPDITVAVVWRFIQSMLADDVPAGRHPALCALSARAEALPAFASSPLE